MEEWTREQLIERLREREELIAQLQRELTALRELVEKLQKEAARQAAPFRRRETQKVPPEQKKTPGRPVGHPGVNRPVPAHIDHFVRVPLRCCPHCQGAVSQLAERVQYIEEIPPVQPVVTQITTFTGCCRRCGEVESTHPLMTGRGSHASAVHLGPRAIAFAAVLNKHHGITMRKTCRILKDAFGLQLSPGGLSQRLDRLADACESDYQQLIADIRAGPAAYVDETSWWVNGPGHWLHGFTNPTTTVYRVESNRSSAAVNETLGSDYAGVLVSDCLAIYDDGCTPIARKHKCIAHHLKAIREQLSSPGLGDRTYLENWKGLFEVVCEITANRELLGERTFAHLRARTIVRRDLLLSQRVEQEQDRRIQNRLMKRREYLLTCLDDPQVESTNNRAERALRPAVIARKVSCGNKTERGKTTWERLASLAATMWQRGKSIFDFFTRRTKITPG